VICLNNDYTELLKNVKEASRKRSTIEVNKIYILWLDIDLLSFKEVDEILADVRANVPKEYKGKKVLVGTKGTWWQ
jgi:putative transposon-encoded protein